MSFLPTLDCNTSLTNVPPRLTGFIPGLIHALYIIFKY